MDIKQIAPVPGTDTDNPTLYILTKDNRVLFIEYEDDGWDKEWQEVELPAIPTAD